MTIALEPIPQPPPKLIVGNVFDIDNKDHTASTYRLHQRYGEIIKYEILAGDRIFVGSQKMVDELCDPEGFERAVTGAVGQVRNLAGDSQSRCSISTSA